MNKKLMAIATGVCFLTGCDQSNAAADTQAAKVLADKSVANMVPVQGGEFLMGDFGPLVGEKLTFSPDKNNKPLHWVELSDFKISKNKVSWGEFNKWLIITNKGPSIYYKKLRTKVEGEHDKGNTTGYW